MRDTNVLISAIVFPNDRMDALIYKAALNHRLVLSSYIIDELLEVTERKFSAKAKDVDLFLTRLYTRQSLKMWTFLLLTMVILLMWRLKNRRLSPRWNF